jgi:hypothetical protein
MDSTELPTRDDANVSEAHAFREERIAQLEQRLARRSPTGVKGTVAAVGLGLTLWLFWLDRFELAYFFSPGNPIELGREGDYRFEGLASNRWAQIRGAPTSRGAYARDSGQARVAIGLRDTPVVVFRRALPGERETWQEGRMPPQPDQRPFFVRGRLLSAQDAARLGLDEALTKLGDMGEVSPTWLLVEGPSPRMHPGAFFELGGLATLALFNLWLLVRALSHHRTLRRIG